MATTSPEPSISASPPKPMTPAADVPSGTPSSLFDRANAARRSGDLTEASRLYRHLQSQFPHSSEAQLSIAIAARMELDRGEASTALAGFRAYLATGHNALRQEAMEGRALALRRLRRTEEETQAWQVLLQKYPASAYAKILREHKTKAPP